MIRAFTLIFAPERTWIAIEQARRGIGYILLLVLLPLILLSGLAEGYALTHWARAAAEDRYLILITPELIWRIELTQALLGFAMVFGAAQMIRWTGESFNVQRPFIVSLTLAAYGLCPIFWARFLHCHPAVNIWFAWVLGACGSVIVLYQGVGVMLQPEPTKGFGLYLLMAVLFTLISGMAHLIALMVIQGKIAF